MMETIVVIMINDDEAKETIELRGSTEFSRAA
jgi:hypothetical protein